MKRRDPQKNRTRRLCIYAFLLSACIFTAGVAVLVADQVSGRVLFGNEYHTALPTIEPSLRLLPARWRVLWELLQGQL